MLVANKGAVLLENGKLISRTVISSGPTRLAVPPSTHVTDIIAIYGAGDGSIGLISYEEQVIFFVPNHHLNYFFLVLTLRFLIIPFQ